MKEEFEEEGSMGGEQGEEGGKGAEFRLKSLFNQLDSNRDGRIDAEELTQVLCSDTMSVTLQ